MAASKMSSSIASVRRPVKVFCWLTWPSGLKAEFDRTTGAVLAEAELAVPAHPMATGGGRRGRHSEHLGYLLAEMQVLAREFPGASW